MTKQDFIKLIPTLPQISVVFATTTRMPMVFCHEETMDDYILAYIKEEGAKARIEGLKHEGHPAFIVNCKGKEMLQFFAELRLAGVNAICFTGAGEGETEEFMVQLKEFLRIPEMSSLLPEKQPVENPSLHLSMLYFMQELRRPGSRETKPQLMELEEEASANVARARFLVPCREVSEQENREAEGKNEERSGFQAGPLETSGEQGGQKSSSEIKRAIVMLRNGKGESYLPLFTDGGELRKFMKNKPCPVMICSFSMVADMVTQGNLAGVLINPVTSNVMLSKPGVESLTERF